MQLPGLLRFSFIILLFLPLVQMASKRVLRCIRPIEGGNCYGYITSYGYNVRARKCESFIYGGCGGNDNRFTSMHECQKACRDI